MNARGMIKRIIYYKDWRLLLKIFLVSLKISLVCLLGKSHLLLALIPPRKLRSAKNQDKDKIIRYVNLCLFLRKKIGINDNCLTRSLLLCYALRQSGIDERLSFGVKRRNGKLIGHCWMDKGLDKVIDYQNILIYP